MKQFALTSLLAGTLLAAGAYSQEGKIQERREDQQKRISQGIATGEVTPHEAEKLEKKEAKIDKKARHYRKSGGKLTRKERQHIQHDQNQASKEIYQEKHDNQKVNP